MLLVLGVGLACRLVRVLRLVFVLKIGDLGGVCVRGVRRVLSCLLLVLTAELLPAWLVQRGRVPPERQRLTRHLTAKSAHHVENVRLATFIFRCVVIRVSNPEKMLFSSVM